MKDVDIETVNIVIEKMFGAYGAPPPSQTLPPRRGLSRSCVALAPDKSNKQIGSGWGEQINLLL